MSFGVEGIEGNGYAAQPIINASVETNPLGSSKGRKPGLFGKGAMGGAVVSSAAPVAGSLLSNGISGGLSSGAGSAVNSLGTAIGSGIATVNPLLGAAVTVGSNVLGGVTNKLFGSKLNQGNIADVENKISGLRASGNALSGSTTNNDVLDNWGSVDTGYDFDKGYIGKDGLFSNKAKNKYKSLVRQRESAIASARHGLLTGVENADENLDSAARKGFVAAYGGPLGMMMNNDDYMGPIEYGLLSDYVNMKNKQAASSGGTAGYTAPVTYGSGGGLSRAKDYGSKRKPYPNVKGGDFAGGGRSYPIPTKADAIDALRLAGLHGRSDVRAKVYRKYPELKKHACGGTLNTYDPYGTFFADGGPLHNHGADWSTGLTEINEGGMHEENPYGGVPYGVAPDGEPNLVEEKEAVYNDNVYSERVKADEKTVKDYGYPKKYIGKSFAYIARDREKKVKDRPNDPIANSAFKKEMDELFSAQETQKQRLETERLRKAFEALSPEEQRLVLQQIQEAEQQSAQVSPEEQAMREQQVAPEQQVTPEQPIPEEAPMEEPVETAAEGGALEHRFDGGGPANVGSWNDGVTNQWETYSYEGIYNWLKNQIDKWSNASNSDEKQQILTDTINTFNALQAAYAKAANKVGYNGTLNDAYSANNDVKALQEAFNKMGGNTGFSNIANDITRTYTGNTSDNTGGKWTADSLWGPQTSIRNGGSTQYLTDHDDTYLINIKDLLSQMGLNYDKASSDEYKYGNSDNPYYMYILSLADNNGNSGTTVDGQTEVTGDGNMKEVDGNGDGTDETTQAARIPYRRGLNTLIGNAGPYVGLGLYLSGVGKPDTSELSAAQGYLDNTAVAHPAYVGNYLRYRPFDVWANQNLAGSRSLATDRAVTNTNSPSRAASLLANGYTAQLGNGSLYQKAMEYNDGLRQKTAQQASETDRFNASSDNQAALANMQARNQAASARASLAANIAKQRQDSRDVWNNALYQNLGNIFSQYAARGKEDRNFNNFAALLNAGYGNGPVSRALVGELEAMNSAMNKAGGGRIKKRKRGLTI